MPIPPESPYYHIEPARVLMENEHAIAFLDRYPVSLGHALVIPRQIVDSIYDLAPDEQAAVYDLVAKVRELLAGRHRPDGFNIGINDGPAAGQTISHAHMHIIPRYKGDVSDPRGGIRWVIPEKAKYWV
ncbi:HIT family protein [Thermodesulfobacteriota bacterium]